ncbi:MAG: hypothetical protein PUF81_02675 [Lachnospiraceae bacterium]|nr:hypothetical protein [Lachnospiraceae bacterium]MDY4892158.1 hypothetical protein [Agathobacter sp.]
MGAQDNTEKVLRSLHVLLSKSEPYPKEPSKVIIDKQQVLDLLAELNTCIYQIMDEYELTKQSRDKAEREFHKKGDQIIWDASRKAEDVYAASVMYMDETLNRMQDILKAADEKVGSIYKNIREEMEKEERAMKTNQLELKGQLQDLVDTEKYLKLIEERNREIEKEKHEGMPEYEQEKKAEKAIYADRQTGIKVNQAYLDKLGLSPVEEEKTPEIPRAEEDDEELRQLEAEIRVNLDADYFQWKDEKESSGEEPAEEKEEKPAGFQKKLKNLIGGHIHDNPGL